ncbi:MAG: hypothetical protein IJY39_03225 [Clostridia bacterium]|nr:hypothetical protein [Clostridia bacterium]
MSGNDILKFLLNTLDKVKSGILSLLGKSDDAYNEYDLSLTVTDHHYGEGFDPTDKKVYNGKIKVYLGNVITACVALFSVFSFVRIIKNIFKH